MKRIVTTIGLVLLCVGCADAVDSTDRSGAALNPHDIPDAEVEVQSETRDLDPEEFQCLVGDSVCRFGTRYNCEGTGEDLTFVRTDFGCGDALVQHVLESGVDIDELEKMSYFRLRDDVGRVPAPGDGYDPDSTPRDPGDTGGASGERSSTTQDRSSQQNSGTGSQTQPSPGL